MLLTVKSIWQIRIKKTAIRLFVIVWKGAHPSMHTHFYESKKECAYMGERVYSICVYVRRAIFVFVLIMW